MCRSLATASTAAIRNPGHILCVIDLLKRRRVVDIDLRPYIAPHTLKLGPDGLIYITCENSAVVAVIDRKANKVVDAIDSGSTNGHRLIIAPDGQRLYTENEEDGAVSVIDLPRRKLLGKIKTPQPLAGIAISAGRRNCRRRLRPGPGFVSDRHQKRARARRRRAQGRAEGGADRPLQSGLRAC